MERASLRQAFISVFVLKSSRLSVFARDPGLGNSFTLRREGAKRTDTSKDRISVSNLAPWRLCERSWAQKQFHAKARRRKEDRHLKRRIQICFDSAPLGLNTYWRARVCSDA